MIDSQDRLQPTLQMKLNFQLSPSASEPRNPCSGPLAGLLIKPSSDWPMRLKWNLKRSFDDCWVRWGPRSMISALSCKRYYPWLGYVYNLGKIWIRAVLIMSIAQCILTFTCINKRFITIQSRCFVNLLDFDECADNKTDKCAPNALCTNSEGSYVCRCLKGYEGDGRRCVGKIICVDI